MTPTPPDLGKLGAAMQPSTAEMLHHVHGAIMQEADATMQVASLIADRSLLLVAATIYALAPTNATDAARKAFDLLDAFVAEGQAWGQRKAEAAAEASA